MLAHVAPVTTSFETSRNPASLKPRTSHHHLKNNTTINLHTKKKKSKNVGKFKLHKPAFSASPQDHQSKISARG